MTSQELSKQYCRRYVDRELREAFNDDIIHGRNADGKTYMMVPGGINMEHHLVELVELGADVHAVDSRQYTVLDNALERELDSSIIRKLIEYGVKCSIDPKHHAINSFRRHGADFVLRHYVDPGLIHVDALIGDCPLIHQVNDEFSLKWLVVYNADLDIKYRGKTILTIRLEEALAYHQANSGYISRGGVLVNFIHYLVAFDATINANDWVILLLLDEYFDIADITAPIYLYAFDL